MEEHLDEGILHGFVGIGRIAQVVIGDTKPAALQQRHERTEPVAGRVALARHDERLDLARERGSRRRRRVGRAAQRTLGGDFNRSS